MAFARELMNFMMGNYLWDKDDFDLLFSLNTTANYPQKHHPPPSIPLLYNLKILHFDCVLRSKILKLILFFSINLNKRKLMNQNFWVFDEIELFCEMKRD